MRRKRKLVNGSVTKWKASLNVIGSKQVHGFNYWETYAPVAQWISIRLNLCLLSINGWKVKTFDFVHTFPQAPSEARLYIDIPKGCTIDGNRDDNIYGQKQAGRVWYKFLTNKLIDEMGFQQSMYDPCVLWKSGCLLVDNTIVAGPLGKVIDQIINDISNLFKITYEDSVNNFLGININRKDDGSIVMTQPKLRQEIINDLGLKDNSIGKVIPALSLTILQLSLDDKTFDEEWNY
jgi:Reverse transcriptase (RNA-dependent DNA polymerase)